MTTPFATTWACIPWMSGAASPAAMHAGGKTWLTWESVTGQAHSIVGTVYDHATASWTPMTVGSHPLVDDAHGGPAMVRDHEGYWHCFYGAHNTPLKASVTTAPDTPTWTARPDIAGANTYPHPVLVGSTLYLFYRRTDGNTMPLCLRRTTSLAGGIAVWGPEQVVLDLGPDTRTYLGVALPRGTDIYLSVTRATYADDARRDQYVLIYESTTNSVRTLSGWIWLPLPVTRAQADTSCRVVTQTTNRTDIAAMCFDGAGTLHLVYADGTGPFPLYHTAWDGTSWTTPAQVGIYDAQPGGIAYPGYLDEMCLVPTASGVELWHPADTGSFAYGGAMIRRSWTGTWDAPETMLAAGTLALARPSAVRDAHPDARVIYADTAQDQLTETSLRLFLHGDSGYLFPPPPPGHTVLILDQSSRGDRSSALRTLTTVGTIQMQGDDLIFGGSGHLTCPDDPDWTMPGDFTIEAFGVRFSNVAAWQTLVSQYDATSSQRSILCYYDSGHLLGFAGSLNGVANTLVTAAFTPVAGTNYDLCWERSGTTVRLYVNGVKIGSGTLAGALFASTVPLAIGCQNPVSGAANRFQGRLLGVRITKDAALYATDTSYTVPTLPL